MIFKREHRKLEEEIEQAKEQLERVEQRDERVDELHRKLTVELAGNHMGDRLKEHFRQSRRRPNNGVG